MAISPRFPAPRGGGGSEGVETVSRGPRVDSNLPPPFYPPLRSNVRADSKPSNEMALAAKRILVTDTGNGRGRRPFPSHARPSMRIYIYIYTSPTPTFPVPGQSNYFFLLFFPPLSPSFSSSPCGKKLVERVPLEIFTYTTGCGVVFLVCQEGDVR